MTPAGHLSISYLLGKELLNHKSYMGIMIMGIIPDIDFLLFWLPNFNEFHRIITHNILFICVVSYIVFLINKSNYCILFLAGFLHLFIDSIMDANATNGIGVAFLYPFDNSVYSLFNITPPINNSFSWDNPLKFIRYNYMIIIYELPITLFASIMFAKRKLYKNIKLN